MSLMTGHLQDVGDSIKQAGDAYDRLVGSLNAGCRCGARRFRELGVQATSDRLSNSAPVAAPVTAGRWGDC
jgi:DNA anti-recombination protein RmuC